ncbi:MAG: nucleotide-binding protein [Pseudomonadota bacterium]|nr:nucleotide-binding protein [Pseudomonadota bacterium]
MSDLLARFLDPEGGRRRLLDLLLRQPVVGNTLALASALAESSQLLSYRTGETLIQDGGADTDIHLILVGETVVEVRGRPVATRVAGQHVGELALIDTSQPRSATVRATKECVIARVPEAAFSAIAEQHPDLWRRLAVELGDRLRQRARAIVPPRERPEVFVGSCSTPGALDLARALQGAFGHEPWTTRVWTDGTFAAGATPIEALMSQLDTLDFGILVVTPDDLVVTPDGLLWSPRDNVVFELGLLMGRLGRERTFVLRLRGGPEVKLPSDLAGVIPLEVAPGDPGSLRARIGPAAHEIRETIRRLGGR